jgi:hypothetical protein
MAKKFTLEQLAHSNAAKINGNIFSKKERKYKNQKVEFDGQFFDSKKELARYKELYLLHRQGLITNPLRQLKFLLIPKNETERKCEYVADFVYTRLLDNKLIVEDVKSEMTRKLPAYIIKRKLMKHIHNIEIKEV